MEELGGLSLLEGYPFWGWFIKGNQKEFHPGLLSLFGVGPFGLRRGFSRGASLGALAGEVQLSLGLDDSMTR